MKHVMICANLGMNIQNFRMNLIENFSQNGFKVSVSCVNDSIAQDLQNQDIDVHAINMDVKGTNPFQDVKTIWEYYKIFKSQKPDILLFYTVKPNIYGSFAARILGIPFINTVTGLGSAFISNNITTRIVKILYKMAFSKSHKVFFQNPDDRDVFVENELLSQEKIGISPGSGIDTEFFKPADKTKEYQECTFLLIARLLGDKGIQEYVEAAKELKQNNIPVRCQLLGPLGVLNPTAIKESELDSWIQNDWIDYLGETKDVRPYIANADCVVLPSYREGLPRTMLEAGSMAKPLIATDVPGCREVVKEGQNGYLCKVRDSQSLKEAMEKMISLSKEERLKMGQNAREYIQSTFDVQKVNELYLNEVNKILGER